MRHNYFLLVLIGISVIVSAYFMYFSQESYAKYHSLSKKVEYMTYELQRIRIEKKKVEFQLASLREGKNINPYDLAANSQGLVAKDDLVVEITPPDPNKRKWGVTWYEYVLIVLLSVFLPSFGIVLYFSERVRRSSLSWLKIAGNGLLSKIEWIITGGRQKGGRYPKGKHLKNSPTQEKEQKPEPRKWSTLKFYK